ncbi:MAG: helicase-related protein [bacterium]|nr:helicase-related protein [bacterium]
MNERKMLRVPNELKEILIVRITPQFLERGFSWFSENLSQIKKAKETSDTWKDSALFLEKGQTIKPSQVLRHLVDFGYEKTGKIFGRGEFLWQGNILEVWPINSPSPFRIEFFGNTIETIKIFERESATTGPKISFRMSLEKTLPNSFMVHLDHGIGIYRGKIKENGKEYFLLEYAPPKNRTEPDRLLVPREQAKKLSPYIGFETPSVHRLGGTVWFTTRRKVKESTEILARELLELYKKRALSTRPPYQDNEGFQKEFEENFAFNETADQRKATDDVKDDMLKKRPMDRIICGDVGFGKTEIAMRAAFRAVATGKQVALISPTTILADQHLRNFTERFSETGVTIALLSRLTPKKEEKEILSKISSGKIDIVIGTHRLISKDINFANLGLAIIDEEQKFGVKQKERFKEMRGEVDIISLSATPIPRTLSLALTRLRDISVIETPPPGRIAIKTIVLPYSQKIIRGAVNEELARGGQIYFLHNRVETMGLFKEKLAKLLPQVKIRIIHGRMPEQEMLSVMNEFRNKKFDMLLATTIIENGLDFSNVNTLIVEDATKLGLAQAHQLRGRIGRGDRQAYSYFLYRSQNPRATGARASLTEKALARLTALQEFSELGSGYEIALRDLEIRGAGNILGREQSGAINKVGFNLYCQMLNETLEEMRGFVQNKSA